MLAFEIFISSYNGIYRKFLPGNVYKAFKLLLREKKTTGKLYSIG